MRTHLGLLVIALCLAANVILHSKVTPMEKPVYDRPDQVQPLKVGDKIANGLLKDVEGKDGVSDTADSSGQSRKPEGEPGKGKDQLHAAFRPLHEGYPGVWPGLPHG